MMQHASQESQLGCVFLCDGSEKETQIAFFVTLSIVKSQLLTEKREAAKVYSSPFSRSVWYGFNTGEFCVTPGQNYHLIVLRSASSPGIHLCMKKTSQDRVPQKSSSNPISILQFNISGTLKWRYVKYRAVKWG